MSVPKRYTEEFRRKVLDLVAAGRPVTQIAADLGISDQTIYGIIHSDHGVQFTSWAFSDRAKRSD